MENELRYGLDSMFLLKSLHVFKDLDMEAVYELIKASSLENLLTNEILWSREDKTDSTYLVLEGELGVFDIDDRKCLYSVRPGETLSELSFFKNPSVCGTIRAMKGSSVLEFDTDDFNRLLSNNGVLAACFVKSLGSRLRGVLESGQG